MGLAMRAVCGHPTLKWAVVLSWFLFLGASHSFAKTRTWKMEIHVNCTKAEAKRLWERLQAQKEDFGDVEINKLPEKNYDYGKLHFTVVSTDPNRIVDVQYLLNKSREAHLINGFNAHNQPFDLDVFHDGNRALTQLDRNEEYRASVDLSKLGGISPEELLRSYGVSIEGSIGTASGTREQLVRVAAERGQNDAQEGPCELPCSACLESVPVTFSGTPPFTSSSSR